MGRRRDRGTEGQRDGGIGITFPTISPSLYLSISLSLYLSVSLSLRLPTLHRNQFLNRLPSPRLDGLFTAGFVSSWESTEVVGPAESGSMNSCPRGKMGESLVASLSLDGARGVENAKSSASSKPSAFLAIS